MATETMTIEVVYATPEQQVLLALEPVAQREAAAARQLHVEQDQAGAVVLLALDVPVGTTLEQAIELSGIRSHFPDLVVDPKRVGIFGVKAKLEDKLGPGDRVEIYRPLIADPKEARRKRASEGGS